MGRNGAQVRAVAVAALIVWLAGCLEGGTPAAAVDDDAAPTVVIVPAPDFDFGTAIEEVHDHSDATLHEGSYGFRVVGWDPLSSASGPEVLPGGHTEVSVVDDADGNTWAFIANFGPHRAFSIADVTDPAVPRHVADFVPNEADRAARLGAGSYWDVAAFPGGDLVVSSAQATASIPGLDMDRGADPGGGVFLVNTTDKSRPFAESFTTVIDPEAQVPIGIHNARPFQVDGRDHVAATTANGDTILFEVTGPSGQRALEERSRVAGVHDTTIQVHPLTGQTLLYGARGGVIITDISDPSNPEIIGQAPNGPELSAYHLIVPSNVLIEGRHLTVSGTETTTGTPPFLTFLDTTDPASPTIVSTWQMPFDDDLYLPGAYRWSTHNFDFDHGRVTLAHYHAGVWLIDATSLHNAAEPVTLAYYQPYQKTPAIPTTPLGTDVPAVWGAVEHTDGLVYAADVNTGLHVLEHTGIPSPLIGQTIHPHNQN